MWMQQSHICICGKIDFPVDFENIGQNTKFEI